MAEDIFPDPAKSAREMLEQIATRPATGEPGAAELPASAAALLRDLDRGRDVEALAFGVRKAQKRYFATRTDDDLIAARRLEIILDRVLKGASVAQAREWPA